MHVLGRISRGGSVAGVVSAAAIAALVSAHAQEVHVPPHAGTSLTELAEVAQRLAQAEGVRIERADIINLVTSRPQLRASIEDALSQPDPTIHRHAAVLLVELVTTSRRVDEAR